MRRDPQSRCPMDDETFLRLAHAEFAATGKPPTLMGLAHRTGRSKTAVVQHRKRLIARREWPWPVPESGNYYPRDSRGLAPKQAYWLEVFRRHPAINIAAVAREHKVNRGTLSRLYNLLRARGYSVPPLASPCDGSTVRSRNGVRHNPSIEEIYERARRIREARKPGEWSENA